MPITFMKIFDDRAENTRGKVGGLYALLIGANFAAWAWAITSFHGRPVLLGTALLAYSFGLRHAFDADHIAAIDNVTRKLMQEGKRPVSAGFFFSLGHSTVVAAMTVAIAATAAALESRFASLKDLGGMIGTGVSATFLFAIAIANTFVLVAVWRNFRKVRRGERPNGCDLDTALGNRGLMAHIFSRLFRFIGRSWQLYPIGLLFGLGFDTATEVGLLGISAAEAARGMSLWSILVFPALFAAAMSFADTTDGVVMLGAYGWAFVKPIRKLYYNLTITFVSVAVALVVGGLEALGLLADKLNLQGALWDAVGAIDENFGMLGYGIVAVFVASWAVSAAIYRLKRYDEIEASV